jgi:hypothetical protein
MSDLLRDYERKRRRSMLHFNGVREQVEGFANADRDPVQGEFDTVASKYVFKCPFGPFDPDWTIILGEFAYNTRASLDYLITALVRSTGKKENSSNEFPIYAHASGVRWENMSKWWDDSDLIGRKLQNTPPRTRAALKNLQPFYGVPATNPLRHPLWALSVLNNRDKHRRLNLLARSARLEFVDADGKPIFFQAPPLPTRIAESSKGDTYTVMLTVSPDHANMDMYLLTTYQVALHEPPELIGDLVETLTGINEFIDARVLPTIKALL